MAPWQYFREAQVTDPDHINYHWEPGYKLNNPDIAEPTTVNLYETTLFTLTVTDVVTGCVCSQSDAVAVIISGSALNVNPVAQPATICSGDSTRLFTLAGGGTGSFTYSWTSDPPGFTSSLPDPVVMPEVNTVFNVMVSDGFNSANGSVGVTVNPNPAGYLGSDTTVCVFDTITIDAGNQGASYMWSNGSVERMISVGSTGIGYENSSDSNGYFSGRMCMSTGQRSITFDFIACTGIADQEQQTGMKIYPNPGNGLLYIENKTDKAYYYLSVIDGFGR